MHETMKRLYQAAREIKNIDGRGASSELARLMNTSPQTLKNWEARGISYQGMIEVSKIIGISVDWLKNGIGKMRETSNNSTPLPQTADVTYLDLLDISVSCGIGEAALYDYPDIIRKVEINNDYLKQLFGHRNTGSIKIINTNGDSMTPTIPKNAAVLIDTQNRTFRGDGIYLFYYNGKIYLKRLQQVPGGVLVISDNKRYETFSVTTSEAEQFNIIGSFVGTLSLQIE